MLVLKLIILSVILIALAMAGMGVSLFLKKNGSFPEHRVGHNKEMRKRKIYCVKTQEKIEQNEYKKRLRLKVQEFEGDDKKLLVFNQSEDMDLDNLSLSEK